MKLSDFCLSTRWPSFGKYLPRMAFLTLFALFFAGGAQAQGGGCNNISYTFEHYEPCKFRARYQNTSECFIEIRYILASGEFASWNVNAAAGFTVDVISPSELWVHHNGGFMPLGNQVPLLFTLPYDLNTTMGVAWLDDCQQVGCELFPGIPLESCPDPMNASIIGVKYRECGNLPYSNQPVLSDWTIQLLNADSNLIEEQVTDADGNYAFYDRPLGLYIVREAQQPGWTPKVPATGQYTVDLAPSQQVVRNFGNCPSCSCDNIYMDVVQLPISSDTCSYILNVSNNDDYCFNEIDLKVAAGSFASVTPAAGWTATLVSPQHYKLTYPPNYIPAQSFQSTFFTVTGAAQHDITVSTSWNNNGVLVTCSRPFSYKCPPPVSPAPCCPMGSTFGSELVKNSNFSLGNQDFTNGYNYFTPGGPTAIGSYSVLNYGQVYTANNQWACIDHTTYTTTGLMLIVDGYGGPIAWEQQVSVTAGTTYAFSAWFNNLVIPTKNYDDPQMALWVNGNQIAASPILMENPDRWEWLCAQYTATQTGLVTLQIRMLATTSIGNDVGIDDISFRQCIPPPSCVCLNPGAFSNMSYKPNSGPNVPIACGQIAFWQCQLPVFNLGGDFMCVGNNCDPMPPISWTLSHPVLGLVTQGTTNGPSFLVSVPSTSFSASGLYTLRLEGICGTDTCYCDIIIETPGCGGSGCTCLQNGLTYSTAGTNITMPCNSPNFPVFFCPTGPVTISGGFGCVDANGNPCPMPPAPINWTLYHNGIVQQGAITTGTLWTLPFTAADLAGSGFFTMYMTTLCPGQMDSCKCVVTWFQECEDPCECGPNPWDSEIRYGGAQNQPVQCGDTLNVTTGSAFYPNFLCQGGPNCNPGRVDWTLTGPGGYFQSAIGVIPNSSGGFVIPPLQPTNFPNPGTYCLQMLGICDQDTCPCIVYFCLGPQIPVEVHDSSICRTLTSAYIPLYGCPITCNVTQVQWFVKPCSAANFPTIPYQVSSGPNCDPLLFLPYQYPGEACVQVYAVVTLAPGCCVPDMTTNIATIYLCDPISCSISNPNQVAEYCQCGTPQLPLTVTPLNANCNYTVQWYHNGQIISGATGLTYQPGQLCYQQNAASDCYYDHVFTAVFTGVCGTSSCSTTIRVYDPNAPDGTLDMVPFETQPFCPGEDATLCYTEKCSGTPPKWTWYSSTVDPPTFPGDYTAIPNWGNMDPKINTNKLWQTTWYLVEKTNGVCPPDRIDYRIEVKDPLTIVNFTAIPDPCIENYVVLTVDFTPTPNPGGGQPGCGYTIEWYKDGNLIHTSFSLTSSVSYTYLQAGSVAGVYYAIVKDDCCNQAVKTWPIILNPSCVPGIDGPCYVCDKTTQYTLTGAMILPPQDPCPPGAVCTYQWYQLDIGTGTWVPVGTPNSLTFTTTCGGHFQFESICDYGYGPCKRSAYHDVAQCTTGVNGCQYVDAPEVILPIGMQVEIHPNPTTGSMTVQISPAALRKGRVEVVDVNGKVLASDRIPENQASHTLSLAHLPNGLYFVRVFESDVLVWVGKIVRSE